MNDDELRSLGRDLVDYCQKYDVPVEFLFRILKDQKVTPMIRGKAMEYNGYLILRSRLNLDEWGVDKLNLNPQPGTTDQDISVTHRRTGITLKVETKSACRASFSTGKRSRIRKAPHFKVKCHRSRSHIGKTTNDRYETGAFDVLMTNPLNAAYQGGTVGEDLEIIDNKEMLSVLYEHYKVGNEEELREVLGNDWRFAIATEIAEALPEGRFLPRTPYVSLANDPNWLPMERAETRLFEIVKEKDECRRRERARRGT